MSDLITVTIDYYKYTSRQPAPGDGNACDTDHRRRWKVK